MAFDVGAVTGQLTLNIDGWQRAIEKVKTDMTSLQGAVLRNASNFRTLGVELVALGGAMTAGIGLMVKGAAEDERIFGRLRSAIENTGISYSSVENQVKAFTESIQKSTTFSHDQAAEIVQRLLPYTKDLGKAFEGTKIAVDMAASGMFDYTTAAKYVGMAMSGNVEMLGRMIPELRINTNEQLKNMSAAEKTAYALNLLKTKFGGMAAGELNTFSGKMAQLKNTVSELSENLGSSLLPVLTNMAKSLIPIVEGISRFAANNQGLTQVIMLSAASFGALSLAIGGILIVLPSLISGAVVLGISLGTLSLVAVGIAAAFTAVVLAVQHWDVIQRFMWAFAEGVNNALAVVIEGVAKFYDVLGRIPLAGGVFAKTAEGIRSIGDEVNKTADFCAAKINESFNTAKNSSEDMRGKFISDLSSIGNKVESVFGIQGRTAQSYNSWLRGVNEGFNAMVLIGQGSFQTLQTGLSGLGMSIIGMGSSIKEVFASMGNSIIKMLMDIAAQWIAMKIIMGISSAIGGLFSIGAGVSGGAFSTASTTTSSGLTNSFNASQNALFGAGGSLGFADGATEIPYTGYYKVHSGEDIVPKYDSGKGREIAITVVNQITPGFVNAAIVDDPDTVINVINENNLRNGTTRKIQKMMRP